MQQSKDEARPSGGSGLAMGVGIGVAVGVAMDNIGAGVAIGVALGLAFGAAQRRRKPHDPASGGTDAGGQSPE